MRVLDEAVGEHGDVHQPVLVDADVDEGAEVGDVGHRPLQDHAGLEIRQGLDPLHELGRLELGARVAPGLLQLAQDVLHRGHAEALVGELLRLQAAQGRGIADHLADALAHPLADPPYHRIGLRVHGGGVERLVPVRDAQEASAQLEGLVAEARHGHQPLAVGKGPVGLAEGDDVLGEPPVEPGHLGEQWHRGGVEIHPDRVYAVLHHRLQGAGEARLVDIVLILPDPDRLGLDLDQLGQRVLETPGDRDRPAQRHVETRQLLRGDLRGRVDRGPRLAHHQRAQAEFRMALDEFARELVGLARGGAIADAHQPHLVLGAECRQPGDGGVPLVLGDMRIDGVGRGDPPGRVDHRHLDPSAQARVQPQGRQAPGRGGEQQGLEIEPEDADRLLLRGLQQTAFEVQVEAGHELDPPGLADRLCQPVVRRPAGLTHPEVGRDQGPVRQVRLVALPGDEIQTQDPDIAPTEECERPMGGHLGDRLAVVEVVGELVALGLLALDDLRDQDAVLPEPLTQPPGERRVLGEALHEDLARAFEGRGDIRHALAGVDERGGAGVRVLGRIGQEPVGQWFEPRLAGDLGLGPALGLVGEIQVLQALLGVRRLNVRAQFRGELALLGDAREDAGPPLGELAEIDQALLQVAELGVIEATGDLLAVAGDKGHRSALVQQPDGRLYLVGAGRDFLANGLGDGLHGVRRSFVGDDHNNDARMGDARASCRRARRRNSELAILISVA